MEDIWRAEAVVSDHITTIINIREAKRMLSRLVKRGAAGEVILLANRGAPVAMLTRIPASSKKIPWDVFKGKVKMSADFDGPLDGF